MGDYFTSVVAVKRFKTLDTAGSYAFNAFEYT